MLYVLGGVSRCGKSMIASRLVVEKSIPFFCIDLLITALQEGVPDLGIEHSQDFIPKAEKLWPIVKPLMEHRIYKDSDYLIEGDGILPSQISELINSHPYKVKACFVGFSEVSSQDKFRQVKNLMVSKDDWTKNISDKELLVRIKGMIEVSKYLNVECQKYSIPYFDSSNNFQEYLEKVFQYLTK